MRRAWLAENTGHSLDAAARHGLCGQTSRGPTSRISWGRPKSRSASRDRFGSTVSYADGSYYVPFATTEGTLVTTYQYGMRAITEAGGANAHVLADSLDITPCFVLADAHRAISFSTVAR